MVQEYNTGIMAIGIVLWAWIPQTHNQLQRIA
jgi:hypothetical protein